MGTRNLTCVIYGERHVVARYGQWDGYPSGQGLTALGFVRDRMDPERFTKRLLECRWVTEEEVDAALKAIGSKEGWVTMEQSAKLNEMLPYLTRDHGAEILEMIQDREDEPVLRDSFDFAGDGLMCEWAYVIDLDRKTFEVYEGFKSESQGRFAHMKTPEYDPKLSGKYAPVSLVATWPLADLPSDEVFLRVAEQEAA